MRYRYIAAAAAALPSLALAHEGAHAGGSFMAGVLHPVTGTDHLLALIAVGLLAGRMGGRALWMMPAAFLSLLVAGILGGIAGMPLPLVEVMILASVMVCGLLVVVPPRRLPFATVALAGFFALFHGHAHGSEAASGAALGQYTLGLLAMSALILTICAAVTGPSAQFMRAGTSAYYR